MGAAAMSRVLVACEESQEVCKAFREKGHEAYSCDIIPCSGGHPEWHIQVDALELLKMQWDMIIAFPPCTYLSNAGARHLFKGGELNTDRYQKGLEAKEFFLKFLNADCPKVAVENPISSKIYEMPPQRRRYSLGSLAIRCRKRPGCGSEGCRRWSRPILSNINAGATRPGLGSWSAGRNVRRIERKHSPAWQRLWPNNGGSCCERQKHTNRR